MEVQKKKLGRLARSLSLDRSAIDQENRTVEIAYSSEEPYDRWFGVEILSHDPDAVDLEFLKSGNAPLLLGHNHDDQIGVIEKAEIGTDRVGRAVVRFGRSGHAEEIFQDVKDGIRSNISVGYYINEMVLQQTGSKEGTDEYLVTKWTPVEASIVAVPADTTVGIGRADEDDIETIVRGLETRQLQPDAGQESEKNKETVMNEEKKIDVRVEEPHFDLKVEREKEASRARNIRVMAQKADMVEEGEKAVLDGTSTDEFRAMAFDRMLEKMPAVDMDDLSRQDQKDTSSFSFVKAIREFGEGRLTGVEKEMHDEGVKQNKSFGQASQGLVIPYQVLAQRDITVGTDSAGGYTVATNLLAGSFIELLQNRILVKQMGATVLDGLVGDIAIPTQATGATAAWEGENDAGSESSPTFGQLALSPNRVGAYVEISKKLIVQSSLSVENIVRNLIADSIALKIDLAALHGTGSNDQPTGIASTTGIGSVAGGTNGAAPTWAHMVTLETEVSQDNADVGKLGYLTNAKVRGKLKQTEKASNTAQFVWADGNEPGFGMMNGYRAGVSNQVSSTLTKGSSSGVCSAIFFGNWADLILAFWGGMDVVVDPFSLATTNLTRVTTNTYADVGVRHAASFAAMLDATT